MRVKPRDTRASSFSYSCPGLLISRRFCCGTDTFHPLLRIRFSRLLLQMGVVLSLSISRMRLRFAGSLYEKLLIAPQIHQLIKLSAFPKIELLLNLKTEMAPDSAGVRSGL